MKSCPRCSSPDVVSYWTAIEKEPVGGLGDQIQRLVLKSVYGDAERCVDCHAYWFTSVSGRLLVLDENAPGLE